MSKEYSSKEEYIRYISEKILHLETLDTRNRDRLDFYYLPVWQIKQALEDAYDAGFINGSNA